MKIQDLIEGCKHGQYYCSTDKKWKCRQGPKQDRDVAEGSLEEIDRRGFLKGLGAAVAGAAGVSNAKASEKKFSDFITDPADKEKYIELRKKADRIWALALVNSSFKVAAYAEMAKLKDFKKELAKKYNIDINLKEEDMAEAHPNSKIYDKCWDGYKKVPGNKRRGEKGSCVEETYDGDEFFEAYGELWFNEDERLDEAEYQGRSVPLGKPMQGDVKKFKVYVKDPSTGNVKKVNFGDPDMKIRKSNPAARRSFRARHNCDNPGPRTKARYWSCRKW